MPSAPTIRAAIYARYSSDHQDHKSIEDQVNDCVTFAERNGWVVTQVYSDAAQSGASLYMRPGFANLMKDADAGSFDIVLAEALDRISRNLGDTAKVHEQLEFQGIRIVTLSESNVTSMEVAFKGLMNTQFLKELGLKVRRGQRGVIAKGRAAGGLSYGYEIVRDEMDDKRNWVRGKRRINEVQAEVVRRIFNEYAAGLSPYEIVRGLNGDSIRSARGGDWGLSAIIGHRQRKVGILHNELYIGRLYYNRITMKKDPKTGKRISRMNPPSEWVVHEAPELRIIDDATWTAVQARISLGGGERMPRQLRRPKHLLSGLVGCPVCGGNMVSAGVAYLICANAHTKATCGSSRKVRREALEERVIGYLKELLSHPDSVAAYVRAYHEAVSAKRRANSNQRQELVKQLADIKNNIARWMNVIEQEDLDSPKSVLARIKELERQRADIERALEVDKPEKVTLHPNAHLIYARQVEQLEAAVTGDLATRLAATQALRSLISRIIVHPAESRAARPEVELHGRLKEFLGLAENDVVNRTGTNGWGQSNSWEGFEPPTNGL